MVFRGDPFGHHGQQLIHRYHTELQAKYPTIDIPIGDVMAPEPLAATIHKRLNKRARSSPKVLGTVALGVVGILGAGVGGLYTAMMLESLNIPLFTHKFTGPGSEKYDYYDAGAMRYPLPVKDQSGVYENGVMKRLGMLIDSPELNPSADNSLKDKLILYYYAAKTGPELQSGYMFYNDIRERISNVTPMTQTFKASEMGVDSEYSKIGPGPIVDDVLKPFANGIFNDILHNETAGWERMMAYDQYSTRGYMSLVYTPTDFATLPQTPLPPPIVNCLELFDKSSEWYDRGFTETVLEPLAFSKAGTEQLPSVEWKCFDGGSQTLTNAIEAYLKSIGKFVQFNTRNTGIHKTDGGMLVETANSSSPSKKYDHVISTLSIPVLRTLDLKDAGLTVKQSTALRQLQYGPSIKIGMRFSTNWWNQSPVNIFGGQSFTDQRMGSLFGSPNFEEQLQTLVLRDLADVHGLNFTELQNMLVETHVWDWNHDPYTM
ncbi:hypothetical protein M422DRAFT_47293 [Sphaerobolus stellatus SS14]|uniref:Amine oxidase domain-containing protein n=1 Tax=Sphaerobolus stellatus (strain SS14) TaxID=990650 RepID=A0A0C9VQH2_SPHS4|nr:hypothetical protein M422DRAFT_47293 [Sphaerobolus stellatus SS14]